MFHRFSYIGGVVFAAAALFPFTAFAAPAVPAPVGQSTDGRPAKGAEIENETPTPGGAPSEVRFTLTEIRVEHDGMKLSDEKLAELSARFVGREITGTALSDLLAGITNYARAHGYPTAAAYIPEQTATEGRLLLRMMPGRLGKITVENESRLDDDVAKGILARLKEKGIIRTKDLESALLLLDDLSGVHAAALLSAGRETGETDLFVKITNDKPASALLYAENYGSESTGRYRYGLSASLENVGGVGGKLTVGGMLSNGKQHAYNIGYETPVGHSATKLGVGYSRSDYELGSLFSQLGASGVAHTYSFWGETPLWKATKSALAVTYGFDYRNITDEMLGFSWEKHSAAWHAGLSGMGRGEGSYLSYRVELRQGTVTADSDLAQMIGEDARTLGGFWKGTLDVMAVQGLGHSTDIMLKAQGQKASRNLDGSEEIYLGGARGVRAYPQGEASGDEGALATLELRYHTPVPGLILSTYFDAGCVKVTKDGRNGSESLRGWGIGATYSKEDDWFARLDYARRIGAPEVMSDDAKSKGRFWFLVGKVF
ncbi:MAG: ShlB/FhaC/HecB family hemolysin secretion/activation protein [Schwartzia sp.]|nr:ShlB/FhaC/HecB family hemolysin secretion/activation protein [Schwartzia sp. (in: firmicutes)]